MIPYFLLLLIPLFLQEKLKYWNTDICIGNSEKRATSENIALPLFFVIFLLLLSLRNQLLGRDLANYKYIFNAWGKSSALDIFSSWKECIFHFYCWFFYNCISKNYQLFISFTAILTVLPIAIVYCNDKSYGYLKAAIFVNMSTFVMLFSGIRQGLAMAVGLLAYRALKNNKNIQFFLLVVISMLIHHSGFMTIFFYPLFRLRLRKNDLLWIVPIGMVVYVLRNSIFNTLAAILGSVDDKYSAVAANTGAIGSFLLFLIFSVFCYLITNEADLDDETIALRNILVFATILQVFASVNNLAMRMNYYFILLIPMAVGNCLNYVNPRYEQIARAAEVVISVFFTFLFFYSTYKSFVTGISALDTIPYVPFWGEMS